MPKEVLFLFTDECGSYQKVRSDSFVKAHPFYVRSNLMMTLDDYLCVEKEINIAKEKIGVDKCSEIKWSHYGNAIRNRNELIPSKLSAADLESFYTEALKLLSEKKSVKLFFTFTVNKQMRQVDEVKLIKMHLQNAFQRVHRDAQSLSAAAFVIADDMNDKTKPLKKAMYELTQEGDLYTEYDNVNKGLFIDYSDQCCGLQLADICAGVFTASLKHLCSSQQDRRKYAFARNLFDSYLYSLIRVNDGMGEWDKVYGFGIRNVPNECGEEHAKKISCLVQRRRHDELLKCIMNFKQELY